MLDEFTIRPGLAAEVDVLGTIELAAAARFREAGIDGAFLDSTRGRDELLEACADGRLWVALRDGEPVGFALAGLLDDGEPFLDEIDVHPSAARRGIGRALIGHVAAWARAVGAASLALTTFRDVQWNAPYYRRLGFRDLAPGEWTPALARVFEAEAEAGLPIERRVAMRLALGDGVAFPRGSGPGTGIARLREEKA